MPSVDATQDFIPEQPRTLLRLEKITNVSAVLWDSIRWVVSLHAQVVLEDTIHRN